MELDYKKKYSSFYGEIPNDWDVKLLPEVFDYIHGKAHEQHIDSSGAFTVVNSKFISSEGKVSKQSSNNFCPAKKGDILTVLSDLPNGKALAKTYYVNVNMKYAVNQRICIWRSKKDYPLFLSYIMNRHKYFMKFDDGVTQTHILNHHIEKCPVLVPSDIKEQKSIATALTDVDELITGLEKLISKKKDIKQGAMQQLLTPKENWKKTCLLELADNKKSQFDDGDWVESEHIISQGVRLVQTGNIGVGQFKDNGNKKYISEDSFNKLNCKEVLEGDLLVCRLAEPAGRACIMPNIGEYKVITSVDVSIFRGNPKIVNREFLSQLFTTNNWFQKVIEKVGGTTHKRISRGALGKIEIEIPLIEEQQAIAQILSDMDAEITQLENKKEKYQAIKQGMMQELLTGKTRLL